MEESGVDRKRRRLLTAAVGVVGGTGAALGAVPFLSAMLPSAKAKAIGAPVELDISKIEPGQRVIVPWRGRPVWVIRRTPEMVERLKTLNDRLLDPDSQQEQQPDYAKNAQRSIKPEILVLVGLCTHLNCSPALEPADTDNEAVGPDWPGGFFCPCHGSKFDLAGRVFKSVPAPLNLIVPPYKYLDDKRLLIGLDDKKASVS
jgi:ubiquinol-cytochrome c reductase iron-sulfur subunit